MTTSWFGLLQLKQSFPNKVRNPSENSICTKICSDLMNGIHCFYYIFTFLFTFVKSILLHLSSDYQEFYLNDITVLLQHLFEHANTYTAIITMTTDTTMITIKEIHDESPDSSTVIDK